MTMVQEPTLIAEVAFPAGASTGTYLTLDDTARGLLDTGTLAPEEVFIDVSSYYRSGTIGQRSSRLQGPAVDYETGACTLVVDDPDRRFDPFNLDGPYVDAVTGETQVTAMRAVRVRATWAGTTYNLFRGFSDNFFPGWFDPGYAQCTITSSDAFKVFAGIDRVAVASVGASELTGARVNRILDSVDWPAVDRVIAAGDSTVQATTLAGDALTELQLVAESELGELYVDGSGRVVFRNRLALLTETRSNTSQATFGDAAGELPYKLLPPATDDLTRYNHVRITREGGTEQVVEDATSISTYLARTYNRTGLLLEDDSTALSYAQWVLHVSRNPEARFVEIEIDPRVQPDDLYPQVLGRQIGDRITIKRRPPPGTGSPIVLDFFIRGIEHVFKPGEWSTRWQLQSAAKYGSFLTLDNPILGVLDSNALTY